MIVIWKNMYTDRNVLWDSSSHRSELYFDLVCSAAVSSLLYLSQCHKKHKMNKYISGSLVVVIYTGFCQIPSYLRFGRRRKNKRQTNIPSTWTNMLIKNDKHKSCMNFLELCISIPWAVFITLVIFFLYFLKPSKLFRASWLKLTLGPGT